MQKGVVLEIRGNRATVLVEGGEFRDISLKGMAVKVGQEITVPEMARGGFERSVLARMRLLALIAAVLVAVLLPVGYFQFIAPGPVMAYVSVDINPSIEFGVDARGRVIEASGVGQDGEDVLLSLSWRGRGIDDVLSDLVKVVEEKGFVTKDMENSVVITVLPRESDELPPGLKKKVEALPETLLSRFKANSIPTVVKVVRADKELWNKAKQLGITPGKAAVLVEAAEQGLKMTVKDIKSEKISKAVPKAGGKVEDLLKKASERRSWAKLLEKHQEQIEGVLTKPEPKPEVKPEPKPQPKPLPKPPAKPQTKPEPGSGQSPGSSGRKTTRPERKTPDRAN